MRRVRVWWPPPQSALHAVHSRHGLRRQLTRTGGAEHGRVSLRAPVQAFPVPTASFLRTRVAVFCPIGLSWHCFMSHSVHAPNSQGLSQLQVTPITLQPVLVSSLTPTHGMPQLLIMSASPGKRVRIQSPVQPPTADHSFHGCQKHLPGMQASHAGIVHCFHSSSLPLHVARGWPRGATAVGNNGAGTEAACTKMWKIHSTTKCRGMADDAIAPPPLPSSL